MKRIYYSSGSILTGDRMADVVVTYAAALATRELSDTVDIPIFLEGGATARAQLLIGPASQLVVVPEPGETDMPEEDATIDELSKRARSLSSPHPQASDEPLIPYYSENNEFNDAIDDGTV
jgi:hypothetical protein